MGKIILGFIVAFTILTVISFFVLDKKYAVSLGIIDLSIIIFAFLVWLNDKQFHERPGQRIFSISDKKFIDDVIVRQMNMHGITEIKNCGNKIEFFKKGHKAAELKFRTDENGKPVVIDGKYVIEIEAPEYILHNIDHETWSLIGKK
ncbi:hypothetical protein [Persephonella sp. KM09-Lau-8]|uniref:hypothetical protein n=1 Tax=Persephonella sp. KM09-Lau-8 TaxID=1158345 RepID=UPI000497E46C|nr:hypothetical protein [Persephonella sp. KM09-Lau-8]